MEYTSCMRVTSRHLSNYINSHVVFVGKVVQLRGDSADIDANGIVTCALNREAHLTLNNAAEIIGKVNPDLTVRTLTALDLGPNIDYEIANAVADVAQNVKEIYTSG